MSIREYPVLKGKDAERFLERQKEHINKLKEKIKKYINERSKQT